MPVRTVLRTRASRHPLLTGLLLNIILAVAAQAAAAADLEVVDFSGPVKVKMQDRWRDPAIGMALVLPATVSTGEGGSIELSQAGSVFSVAPNTALEFFADDSGELVKRVVQSRGSAFYDIANREHRKLRIETPWLAAVVKGTQFNVTVETARASVALFEGLLRIEAPDTGEAIDLRAGFIARRAAGDARIEVIAIDGENPVSDTGSGSASASGQDDGGEPVAGGPAAGGHDLAEPGDALTALPDDVTDGGPHGVDAGVDLGGLEAAIGVEPGTPAVELAAEAALDGDVATIGAKLDADLGSGELGADLGADLSVAGLADVGLDASLDADLGSGELGADLGADLSLGDLADAGLEAGIDVDLGSGELGADLGADLSVGDLADAGLDAGLDADLGSGELGADLGADLSLGDLADAGLDAGLDADLGSGELGADLGADLSLGDLADAGLDAGLDADLGSGELGADLGTDLSLGDLADAELDAGLDADLGSGELGADLGADLDTGGLADTGLDAGLGLDPDEGDLDLDLGADVSAGGLEAGLDVGADPGSGEVGVGVGLGGTDVSVGLGEGGLEADVDLDLLDDATGLLDDLLGGNADPETDEEENDDDALLPGLRDLLGL